MRQAHISHMSDAASEIDVRTLRSAATPAQRLTGALTYVQRIDNLRHQEVNWRWFRGAKGGLFRVVRRGSHFTRVYWKKKPGHAEPVPQDGVVFDASIFAHHKR
jgi:hypothetical protein